MVSVFSDVDDDLDDFDFFDFDFGIINQDNDCHNLVIMTKSTKSKIMIRWWNDDEILKKNDSEKTYAQINSQKKNKGKMRVKWKTVKVQNKKHSFELGPSFFSKWCYAQRYVRDERTLDEQQANRESVLMKVIIDW